jgi:hypothetical protein
MNMFVGCLSKKEIVWFHIFRHRRRLGFTILLLRHNNENYLEYLRTCPRGGSLLLAPIVDTSLYNSA